MFIARGRRAASLFLLAIAAITLSMPFVARAAEVEPDGTTATLLQRRVISFRLQIREQVSFTGAPPCIALSQLQGQGQSPQFGPITMTAQDCINPVGVFDPNGRNAYAFASQPPGAVIALANGEQIFVTTAGLLNRQGRLSGFFVITGGTGAWFGATGGGWLSGQETIGPGWTGQGTIDGQGVILR